MDIISAIKARRSVREYKDKPIPGEAVEKIIDAARFAATARNVQPWEFVVITDRDILRKIAELADNGRFVASAAACIAVYCSDTKYYLEDGCAATENILIAAASIGIGSCWVAGDKKPYCNQVSNLLKAPSEFKLVSLIALGYPASEDSPEVREKKPLGEILHWEQF